MPTHEEHQSAFLAAIAADPDDDGHRLIFADWLEERGDPRGEFVRLQCELAPLRWDDPRRPELERRQAELLRRHGDEWRGEPPDEVRVAFERGVLVAEATAAALTSKAGLRWWRGRGEWVLRLRLPSCGDEALKLAVSRGLLSQVPWLELRRVLYVAGAAVTDVGMRELAGLTRLRALYLDETFLTDAGLWHLAGLERLQILCLNHTAVTDAGAEALSRLTRLRRLYLQNTQVTDGGLVYLTALPHLEALNLSNTYYPREDGRVWLTDAGLSVLKRLPRLQFLSIQGTEVTDEGLKELAAMKQLRSLYLPRSWYAQPAERITEAGVAGLRRALPHCFIAF